MDRAIPIVPSEAISRPAFEAENLRGLKNREKTPRRPELLIDLGRAHLLTNTGRARS
jgi:hypothetical protein